MMSYTYKFRLLPNTDQKNRLADHFGVCRYVYNHFLSNRIQMYEESKQNSTYFKDCVLLTGLKKELTWIKEANSQSLQQELKNLDTSFSRFFKNQSRFPKFHSKHKDKQSFRVPQYVKVDKGRVYLRKFKEGIKINQHRPIEGEIKFATVSRNRSGQHYVCICVEREMPKLKPNNNMVGVDLGLKTLATCSDGNVFENIRPYRNLQHRTRQLHKSLSRKVRESQNYYKAKELFAKCHQKIANIRSNHLHQVSHTLVNENQVIALEDLNVKGMLKNHSLAKSITDVSMSELVRQIKYKAGWYGREVIQIDRWYPSSKTCHVCGYIKGDLTLSDREWSCPYCKAEHDRDHNASLNILAEGLRIRNRTVGTTGIACGESVRLSQESNPRRSTEILI